MKTYNVFPNFCIQVEAKNEIEVNDKAYEIITSWQYVESFDFDIEEEVE